MEPATNVLGLSLSAFIALGINLGVIWYAKRKPGPQFAAYGLGFVNGIFCCFLLMKIPEFGPWFDRGMTHLTEMPFIKTPAWLTAERAAMVGPLLAIGASYFFLRNIIGLNLPPDRSKRSGALPMPPGRR